MEAATSHSTTEGREGFVPRPRVFVSSVVDGFGEFRRAARAGVAAAGGEPVLVNEDFPSLGDSSRNACLDAVDTCDCFVIIVGERGGWTGPSGLLVVEEEYQRARADRIPVLAFLRNGKRDPAAERFARKLSDYVDGTFRKTFDTADELAREVERSVRTLISDTPRSSMKRRTPPDFFASPYKLPYATTLRFVLSPERDEEVIDPVQMESPGFLDTIFGIAHSSGVRLMNYRCSKKTEIRDRALVVVQTEPDGRHTEGEHVRLEIRESGDIVIDANVTGRVQRGSRHALLNTMVVALEDIESVLGTCFKFTAAFYDSIDRFKRHQRFVYNVGLSGLEYRTLERNPKDRSSQVMSMRNRNGTIVAFDEPRLIDRGSLVQPGSEIERVVVLLSRNAGA